jgi:hypothetical protein
MRMTGKERERGGMGNRKATAGQIQNGIVG